MITALTVRQALRQRFADPWRYAIAEEVGTTTGVGCRRLDMIVMDCYYSNSFRIDGFEIKISTSDLRRELEDPEKHISFFDKIDYYTLAVPAGVVDPLLDIIPKKWGIMIVNEDGSTRYKRKPLALEDRKNDKDVPRGFMASFVRAIQSKRPAASELQKEYERGQADGKAAAERKSAYLSERVKRDADKIENYDKLCRRFEIWSHDNMDQIMNEFEAFRKLNIDWLRGDISKVIKKLESLNAKLEGGHYEPTEEHEPGRVQTGTFF